MYIKPTINYNNLLVWHSQSLSVRLASPGELQYSCYELF